MAAGGPTAAGAHPPIYWGGGGVQPAIRTHACLKTLLLTDVFFLDVSTQMLSQTGLPCTTPHSTDASWLSRDSSDRWGHLVTQLVMKEDLGGAETR